MRISCDDKLENTSKAVKQRNVQWPRMGFMVDFCLARDSPGFQLGIMAEREANTLQRNAILIKAGSKGQVFQKHND